MRVFQCRRIASGKVEAPLLISKDDICFYLVDPARGCIIEEGHDLRGMDMSGKILVFPGGKGSSSVQLDGLYQLMLNGKSPAGMIVEYADTILITCAILMKFPLVDRVSERFYKEISNGTLCEIDADGGTITLMH